jgi:hypothetical protein
MSTPGNDKIPVAMWLAYLEQTAEQVREGLQDTTPRHQFALKALIDDIDKAAERLRTGGVLH